MTKDQSDAKKHVAILYIKRAQVIANTKAWTFKKNLQIFIFDDFQVKIK